MLRAKKKARVNAPAHPLYGMGGSFRAIKKFAAGGVVGDLPPTDPKKLKKGLGYVESRDNYEAVNPTSSATGRYQMLYNLIKDQEEMQGVSRDSLLRNPDLQELLMDRRINEGIGGPGLDRTATDLEEEYKGQLGDKWDFRPDEIAALAHFLGRQGTRKYLASLRDGTSFQPPGINKTPEDYLRLYNEGVNR
jgi:hypothetical protein